ncbi:MAG: hypothetical protein JNK30_10330 [Phenylobacterium sp.]|uniref:hypothetical protein n=1 Tax=Phenylobacterium sp. TaxID=1871053 RepID=UPI001A4DD11C|nr:hypothetical protein [Phenylobacterium sp.]MBL8771767.1 hypothetical protein [Phenylobacterium sp.]
MLRLASFMAIAVGALLMAGQVARNFDNLENWLTWGVDVAAGLVLVIGGYRALRRGSDRSLAAAWGIAVGLFSSALATHVQAWSSADPLGGYYAAERQLVIILAGLVAVAAAGVTMSLLGRKRA